jgi:hypothetical protein
MEARICLAAGALALAALLVPTPAHGSSYRTANFVVEASTPELAEKIGKRAEYFRRELAILWLGSAMPNWSRPCPIVAQVAPNLGAGGATSFVFDKGEVFNWDMKIQGTEERLLDSVLPHEVTHTIFASYFRRPLPRWADEGACTTVEHSSERNKQQTLLIRFLRTGHGIAFDQMFAMKEYPPDVLPLYSQGYSLARYLIDQGGRAKFMEFLTDGMKNENWSAALDKHYGVPNLKVLQNEWLAWVKDGSPDRGSQSGVMLASAEKKQRAADAPVFRAQNDDRQSTAASNTAADERPSRTLENRGSEGRGSETARNSDSPRNPPGHEVASAARRNTRNDERAGASPDRGWISSESNAMASADHSWQAAPPREREANVTGATATSSTSARKSVYDRKGDAGPPPLPTPPSGNVPSNSAAENSRRDPEYLAMRDAPVGNADRKVLLEWRKPD